jgi:hypothetical protein
MTDDCQFQVSIAATREKKVFFPLPNGVWQRVPPTDPMLAWKCGWRGL